MALFWSLRPLLLLEVVGVGWMLVSIDEEGVEIGIKVDGG
jgi:hypothetical protein